VDDILIFEMDLEVIKTTKSLLSSNFDMKDMGLADVILGIKIIRKENEIVLTQSHYIKKVLKKFDHLIASLYLLYLIRMLKYILTLVERYLN